MLNMFRLGLNTRGNGSRLPVILVILFLTVTAIYLFLKRMTTKTTAPDFYKKVVDSGFHPSIATIVTAQAAHETATAGIPFTSPIYLLNNNAFGMKNAGQSLVTGESMGHATYNSVNDSIADFKKWYFRRVPWFNFMPFIATPTNYVAWLKSNNYFEAPEAEYLKGVNYFYNLFKL